MDKECWYSTIECPEDPVEGPLNYAIRTFWAGPKDYEWFPPLDKTRIGADGRRVKTRPDGEYDVATPIFTFDEQTGQWKFDWTNDENELYEICCMGLVDESLMQFPYIDWRGYDDPRGDFNHDTWCVPDDPGPGDLAIYVNTKNPKEGHVEFVFTDPTTGAHGLVFEAFGAMDHIVNVDFKHRWNGINGELKFVTFLRPKVQRIRYRCESPDPKDSPNSRRRDPLVLDLDGNGIKTIGTSSGMHFDGDDNGFKELTGWVAPGEGILMLDVNGNGRLDSGKELFGDFMILPNGLQAGSGFQALAHYDANGDGKIDAQDPIWSQLQVWQYNDALGSSELSADDCNGASATGQRYFISQGSSGCGCSGTTPLGEGDYPDPDAAGKVSTLAQLGITAIYLDSTITNTTDAAGNTEVSSGHFEWSNGTSGTIADYSLETDTADTIAAKELPEPADIAALPDLLGHGSIHSLHQAMVRDSTGSLTTLVETFASETDRTDREAIFEEIVLKWTGCSETGTPQAASWAKFHAVEKYYGQQWAVYDGGDAMASAPPWTPGRLQAYHQLFEGYYGALMAQTHLKYLYDQITSTWNVDKQDYETDLSPVITSLQTAFADDPEQGKELLGEFSRSWRGLNNADWATNDYLTFRENFIQQDPQLGWVFDSGGYPVIDDVGMGLRGWSPHIEGTDGSEAIRGSLTSGTGLINGLHGDDVIYGTDRDERILKDSGDAVIVGGGGSDDIFGGPGANIIDGGSGDDRLFGEEGNDIYIFRIGSGHDVIQDVDATEGNIDTIWLGSNLTTDDVALRRSGNNLVLEIVDTAETVTVEDFFFFHSYLKRVEQIQFMDGTLWTETDIIAQLYEPTDGPDWIYGGPQDDDISGGLGDDRIYGLESDDTLRGDQDHDRLYGGSGSDQLIGGSGNDELDGAEGNDIYRFDPGSGRDTIHDTDTTPGNIDTIEFGEGILPGDVRLTRGNSSLTLTIAGTSDSITVTKWLENDTPTYGIERITFADGTTWDTESILDMFISGTQGDDYLVGFARGETILGLDGDDVAYARGGDDTIESGSGNDELFGEDGNDTLLAGDGADTVVGGLGNDVLDSGPGNDRLYGGFQTALWYVDDANGNDTYLFDRGYGQDRITDHDTTPGNLDTIRLREGITPDDISLRQSGDDLKLSISDTTDTLTVEKWFWNDSPEFRVEQIEFADGTIWDVDEIKHQVIQGTSGDDERVGYSTSDTMHGYEGQDRLWGRAGNDTLDGGSDQDNLFGEADDDILLGRAGADELSGGMGHDTLDGGTGNDLLSGGTLNERDEWWYTCHRDESNGNDTYLFGRDSGRDTVVDRDSTAGNVDAIVLDADVATTDVIVRRDQDNLVLSIADTTDTLTVENWFLDDSTEWQVEEIRFAAGTTWDVDTIKQMVLQGTPGDDVLTGYSADDTITGLAGADTIYGNAGADTIDPGAGDDYAEGGTGNDTYLFGRGYGHDTIVDYDATQGNIDIVLLGADVLPSDVVFEASGTSLFLSISGTDDRLQLSEWLCGDAYGIEQIKFDDGTVWDRGVIQQMMTLPPGIDGYLVGTPDADLLEGGDGNEVIIGKEQDDTLTGGAGRDEIYANDGNDTVFAGADDDKLFAGSGDDYLAGEAGDDRLKSGSGTNILEGGTGADTIIADEGQNTIVFNQGDGYDRVTSRLVSSGKPVLVKSGITGISEVAEGNGILFFTTDDGVHGLELWRSDGTEAGTVMVTEIRPGTANTYISDLTVVNGTLFFSAYDGACGSVAEYNVTKELWMSDGTEAGTVMVKDILPGAYGSNVGSLTEVNGTLFFTANDGVHGDELWKTDGTEAGTVMVKDANPGSGGGAYGNLTDVNGTLYFAGSDGTHGYELWKSDGTEEGTVMVQDLYPGTGGWGPNGLTDVNGSLFFITEYASREFGLWKLEPDTGSSNNAEDTVTFGPGISPDDITVQTKIGDIDSGYGMQLLIGTGNGEGMLIEASASDSFSPLDLAIKNFVFDDGTILTLSVTGSSLCLTHPQPLSCAENRRISDFDTIVGNSVQLLHTARERHKSTSLSAA